MVRIENPNRLGWDSHFVRRVPTSFQRECGYTLFGGRPGLSGGSWITVARQHRITHRFRL